MDCSDRGSDATRLLTWQLATSLPIFIMDEAFHEKISRVSESTFYEMPLRKFETERGENKSHMQLKV